MEAAKTRIREKFSVSLENAEVKVSYQDKSKQTAHEILKLIVQRYYEKLKAAGKSQLVIASVHEHAATMDLMLAS